MRSYLARFPKPTLGRWPAAIIALAALALLSPRGANAVPIMTVGSELLIGDWDDEHPGYEACFAYYLRNVSEPGDINNLLSFSLPAGSDHDVFYVLHGSHFSSVEIEAEQTIFQGLLRPGEGVGIEVYTYMLTVGADLATALATGGVYPEPFNPVLVDVPRPLSAAVPEPGSVMLVLGGVAAMARRRRGRAR